MAKSSGWFRATLPQGSAQEANVNMWVDHVKRMQGAGGMNPFGQPAQRNNIFAMRQAAMQGRQPQQGQARR